MTKDGDGSPPQHHRLLLPLLGAVTCALLWPAMITFDAGDWPSPHQYPHNNPPANACGPAGACAAYAARYVIGDGAYPLLLFGTLATLLKLVRGRVGNILERCIGLVLFVAGTSAAVHLIAGPGDAALPVGHGGLVGHAIGAFLRERLNGLGTVIILAATLFVGLLFTTEGWVLQLPSFLRRVGRASAKAAVSAQGLVGRATVAVPSVQLAGRGAPRRESMPRAARGTGDLLLPYEPDEDLEPDEGEEGDEEEIEPDDEEGEGEEDEGPAGPRRASDPPAARGRGARPAAATAARATGSAPSVAAPVSPTAARSSDKDKGTSSASARGGREPIVRFPALHRGERHEPYPRRIENWTLPSQDLLREPEFSFGAQQEALVREQARILERTLEEFRLDAQVVEIDTGPVITMFELRLGKGIKVSQIASLSNDVARALKAHAIRVVAPIPGKNTVGVEVPNVQKEVVRMKELMMLAGKKASVMNLPLFLGKDAGGQPLVADLTKMPHLLIAGTTGSGKSVCINSMIVSLLMTQRPDHVKLILVDPKMVEMSQFKEVPHLMCPIVTDPARAEKILEWAVTKMDERYELLAETRVKNITEYNALGREALYERLQPESESEKSAIVARLPFIVVLIDELADLMMTSPKEVEHHLSRLAQKSRAVGIHIIVATQRPEVRVVTGLIKSNLPTRICFRVASRMDSRIVLDQNGGEVLMGQGDLLYLPPGAHKLIRAQGTMLEDDEVQAVLRDLTSRAEPEFHPELIRLPRGDAEAEFLARDPLFDRAVPVVIESGRGSVSLLQRRLTVGYARASRLIEQMANLGIVGDYKGSQAREVRMTLEEWEELRAQIGTIEESAAGPESPSLRESRNEWVEESEESDGDATTPID
jgi:S-DNA-T family DNA segregation ATPase FtsK/SpoIIIE